MLRFRRRKQKKSPTITCRIPTVGLLQVSRAPHRLPSSPLADSRGLKPGVLKAGRRLSMPPPRTFPALMLMRVPLLREEISRIGLIVPC